MEGDYLLHIACHMKELHIIKLLLERKYNTKIPNNKGETAHNISLNEAGDCLLHVACQWGNVGIVRHLITDEKCNPNLQSFISKDTPLHVAAKFGLDNILAEVLLCKECNLDLQNREGDTALHIAVREMKAAVIFQLLANQWSNPNIQNKVCDIPLHIACSKKYYDVIKLLLKMKCKTNIPNKKGETAQNISLNEAGDCVLHIACQWGDAGIVRYLITDEKCNPNQKSSASKNTPLHIAAKFGQRDTIIQLSSCKECNPNAQNKDGDTPLHIAVKKETNPVISQLLTSKQCKPNLLNKDGDAPLHIAVRENKASAIPQLLADKKCDPNILDKHHLTPLLTAIKHNNPTVAAVLLQHNNSDPTLSDPHGNTPLHLACIAGEAQPKMVEFAKKLLISVKIDPSCVNNAGQVPIELTTNYQLIQAISHIVKCKTKQSVQTYINIFILGNPETGKSTLVKAIRAETSFWWKYFPKWLRRVNNVSSHTAGIIPTKFQSKTFGNTVLYDLAGQVEYYSSHAAVIKSTVISTPPVFVVVINSNESEKQVSQTLCYWLSFIDNHAAQSSEPPQVILVGSHADLLESVQEKMARMSKLIKDMPASFHFAGQVALDCRDPASGELELFCSLVKESCTILRQTADVDLRCHVLYAFLLERFQSNVACTVSDVATSVKKTSAFLPHNPDSLIPLISTLSDKGLLLLVKGGENKRDWWIILQKHAFYWVRLMELSLHQRALVSIEIFLGTLELFLFPS